MRNNKGQFIKGDHPSPKTEFKKGEHWRSRKAHWDKSWLEREYTEGFRSAADIAEEMECTENNILYWLRKHGIPRRSVSEVRSRKHWGSSGEDNPMFGVSGSDHPGWKGGLTPARQALYTSEEWKSVCVEVRNRDSHLCQRCGWHEGYGTAGHIHHIVPFADSEELRTDPDNLVLLCPDCHHWVHSLKNKEGRFIGC